MANLRTINVPVKGMDCTECTQHVRHAHPGVARRDVGQCAFGCREGYYSV